MSRFGASVAWVKNDRVRRLTYLLLAIIAAILIVVPRPYVARAKIVPQDTSASAASTTNLLGALGGGSQSIGSLLTGGRPSNDLYLIISRSDTVTEGVIKSLNLVGPDAEFPTMRKAKIYLAKKVDIHSLLGGVMEIETKLYDPDKAQRWTAAYADAISRSLARFGRQIIINKQRILRQRFENASDRVRQAELNLNSFRRANNLADPQAQLGSALSQRAQLEGQLNAKQIELRTTQEFRGPESTELAAIRSDIAGLRAQIGRTVVPTLNSTGPNVSGLSAIQTQYLDLYRRLQFQQSIYDVYQRSAEQVEVEELAAESASYIQIIDPSHIDAERHYNTWAIAALALIILLALFTEWYAPQTMLFGRRDPVPVDEVGASL